LKTLLILFFILTINQAGAVCGSPVSRTNFNAGNIPSSTKYNSDFNNLYTHLNEINGDCIEEGTILTGQIENGAITTEKIADNSIQASKFALGLIPGYGKPLRIQAYTNTGPWVKQSDVGSVLVQVVGGGGGSGRAACSATNGGVSSFGALCSATGGTTGEYSYGVGGVGSLGNINLSGGKGIQPYPQCAAYSGEDCLSEYSEATQGGTSFFGNYGSGGGSVSTRISNNYMAHGGGGGGGYCARLIPTESLPDNVTVTVGGAGAPGGCKSGIAEVIGATAGLVLIYEFGK
jgi:hypothetical protein